MANSTKDQMVSNSSSMHKVNEDSIDIVYSPSYAARQEMPFERHFPAGKDYILCILLMKYKIN